ncbi:MAG: HAMP domain-containing sensor histidine kinase, partial [Parafilimonas sp.]
MKNNITGIFRRISVLVFSIITLLGILFIIITYFASTYFYKASTQLLNKDVAKHIALFTSPFENNGINKKKADSVFHNAMVLNPSSEVYFLDTAGNVIYYQSPHTTIIEVKKVQLNVIRNFISSGGENYFTGIDPKHAGVTKIFSAAQVYKNDKLLGYIYVILGSSEYGNATAMLFGSHAWNLALIAFITIIIISLAISIYYIKRLQHNYKKVIAVLEEYKTGNFNAQFHLKENNEFAPIANAFNSMTNLLSINLQRLQKSEADRKDLIATISHDLQSPLSVVKGYAETMMLQDGKLVSNEHYEYLKVILLKLAQVEKMVLQLAEISKMEEVNFKPKKESFVFSEIVQETVNTYQLIAAEKKIALKCTHCQNHIWINADISMMERVVQNLVDNAVKNTLPEGKIQVSINVKNSFLIFTISNTGNPLSPELLHWANSSEEELSVRPSKAGLGLLIVKKILRLHGLLLMVTVNDCDNIFTYKMPVIS